ncbi:MAG: hypothetical protein LAQ69_19820 [Acidobacteriia bacterium]|nr:hypothetical protein [Terriglobia bacterium]
MSAAGIAHSQIITTVADGDLGAVLPPTMPALQAPLKNPAALAVDSQGNLFIADLDMNRVLRVSSGGVFTVVAGSGKRGSFGDGGPATNASLYGPTGVAVDAAGNIYIADGSGQVRMVAPNGTISTLAATSAIGIARKIWIDAAGNLFILEYEDILKVTPNGTVSTVVKGLSMPNGFAMDASGNLYLAEGLQNRIRKVALDGTITTVAGTGQAGASGDGGPATAARLTSPCDVTVDAGGSLYIADNGNGRIRKVTPAGIISTVAGGGADSSGDGGVATSAVLINPVSVAVDVTRNLYIGDAGSHHIRKVTAAGIIGTVAGSGQAHYLGEGGVAATNAQLDGPNGLVFDSAGNLYIADTDNHRIRKITLDGIINTVAGIGFRGFAGDGGPATVASLSAPEGVAVDAPGNLYITDGGNNRIRKVSANGTIATIAGGGNTDPGDGAQATKASLSSPAGVVLDPAGNIYFTESNRVRKITPDGIIHTVAGTRLSGSSGDGGPAASAQLNKPFALALNTAGNLYIADSNNSRVRMVTPSGIISTVAGSTDGDSGDGGQATSAQLQKPSGLAVDASGNLYIADSGWHHHVRRVTPAGIISTVVGRNDLNATDGGLATSASLSTPAGLAVDAAGNLYIADSGADRIYKVTRETYTGGPQPRPAVVTNSADYKALIAPSTWITITGADLAPSTRSWADADFVNGLLPVQLDGVRVFVEGMPAYVSYISPTQINALVGAVSSWPGDPALIEVLTPQGRSDPITVTGDLRYAPGLFRLPAEGNKYVIAQALDGTLIGRPGLVPGLATRPARPGEMLTIYGTGFGPTTPAVTPGTIPAAPAPVSGPVELVADYEVYLYPTWAGLIGPGLYQLNFKVPSVPDGDYRFQPRAGWSYGLYAWITIQSK